MEQKELIDIITNKSEFNGAYNIRHNGKLEKRNTTKNVDIITKENKDGIDIKVKDGTKNETILIPVIITEGNVNDFVYNDFYIGKDCEITIVAGCGIDNCSTCDSTHSGIHTFYVGENSMVKYIENHYGHGDNKGKKIFNATTIVNLNKNSTLTMNTTQIEGVDNTTRKLDAILNENSTLVVNEKIMTNKNQAANSIFNVNLDGFNSSSKLSSRVVAKDNSVQNFESNVVGNNKCFAHVECDAIIVGNAKVSSTPSIKALCPDASLVHEATIGKIAGEQLTKLLTLGLNESEAEQQIINGFLK